MLIAYGKGARTFERHIDIDDGGAPVAKYSSLPAQIDTWFKAFHKAKEMSGTSEAHRKIPLEKETAYLDTYVRGVYAKVDLKEGQQLRYGHRMLKACKKDEPIIIDMLDTPYAHDERLKQDILKRGL
jgi:N-acetylneuraminate synthase